MRERRSVVRELDPLVVLQDAALPDGLPIAPRVDLAARYLLAAGGTSAGGDWFDAIPLDDGRVVVAVGDVAGDGVRAAALMGELRVLFEERVRVDGDLTAALELLERRARRSPHARATTVCAAVLEPEHGRLVYCTAGHPPPLLVAPDGDTTYLPTTGAGPLGSGLPFVTAEHAVSEGEVLLLYTDGIVERPGRTAAQNSLDLARVAGRAAAAAPPGESVVERICGDTLQQLLDEAGFDDDITLLAAQPVPAADGLQMVLPAFPDTPRVVRHNLDDWLVGLGVGAIDEMALQHAVGELVSNAVEHAYAGEPDRPRDEAVVEVCAELLPGAQIVIDVVDHGHWRPAHGQPGRGRGLAMASGFADELEVHHSATGTRATLRHRPLRAVELLTASGAPAKPAAPFELREVEHPGHDVVELSGALDQRCADELRRRLAHATRGGTRAVVLDLSGVTLLASAGVQVLYDELAPGRREAGGVVALVAPNGSPAQHVLDLVRLPYRTAVEEGAGQDIHPDR